MSEINVKNFCWMWIFDGLTVVPCVLFEMAAWHQWAIVICPCIFLLSPADAWLCGWAGRGYSAEWVCDASHAWMAWLCMAHAGLALQDGRNHWAWIFRRHKPTNSIDVLRLLLQFDFCEKTKAFLLSKLLMEIKVSGSNIASLQEEGLGDFFSLLCWALTNTIHPLFSQEIQTWDLANQINDQHIVHVDDVILYINHVLLICTHLMHAPYFPRACRDSVL